MSDCLQCESEIISPYGVTFCSCRCANTYSNLRRTSKRDLRPCAHCGASLRNRSGAKYGSNQCQSDFEWQERKRRIEAAGAEARPNIAKKYLIEKYGRRCSICENTDWRSGPIPLVLDHENGNADDNQMTNLRLVCGNCDMQLPTYKSRNRGNGRASRRERYRAGKSY